MKHSIPFLMILVVFMYACSDVQPNPTRYYLINDTNITGFNLDFQYLESIYDVNSLRSVLFNVDFCLVIQEETLDDNIKSYTTIQQGEIKSYDFKRRQNKIYAENYQELMLLSMVNSFEDAFIFFGEIVQDTIFQFPYEIHCDAEVISALEIHKQNESIFYFSPLESFFINSDSTINPSLIPPQSNPGIVVHEVFHLLFDTSGLQTKTNSMLSINEGLADYFGAAFIDDPAFIYKSYDPEELGATTFDYQDPRNWENTRLLDRTVARIDSTIISGINYYSLLAMHNPYILGTIFAGALWQTRRTLDPTTQPQFDHAILHAVLSEPTIPQNHHDVTGVFIDAINQEVETALGESVRQTLCDQWRTRFAYLFDVGFRESGIFTLAEVTTCEGK
jgi:hypothetical protein